MFSQGSIPEVRENAIGYALSERRLKLAQFQDMGPPDLLTIVKYVVSSSSSGAASQNGNGTGSSNVEIEFKNGMLQNEAFQMLYSSDNPKGEIGTFLYTLGVDTSDPTSVAIFLKKIADAISEKPQAWFGKNRNFTVSRITLSIWNAFRKCDVNVVVHIPGNLQTFYLGLDGELLNIPAFDDDGNENLNYRHLWAETFFSGVVRSIILMKDNAEEGEIQNLVETLIVDPLTSGQIANVSDTFIELFPLVYEQGPILGAPVYISNVTRANNYLIETLIEIVKLTKSVDKCHEMLNKLIEKHPEAVVVLARVLFACEREVDAVALVNEQLRVQEDTTDVNFFQLDYRTDMLSAQVEFLLDVKQDYALAQQVADYLVSCSPSEFKPWYLLAKCFVRLHDIENALLTLNACPMSPLKEKYVLKRVVQISSDQNLHLPLPVDAILDEVSSLNPQDVQKEHKSAEPTLVKLAASNLKSTFQLVYKLLTEIVHITRWENLLKYRSNIFVMEEEYQNSNEDLDQQSVSDNVSSSQSRLSSTIRTKRLCERWLDNLFMLLYEDLKTYTLWQTESMYFESQNTKYNKLTIEWELFGMCARRLGHYPEAARAFQIGLSQRFSPGCAKRLLEFCLKENQKIKTIAGKPNPSMSPTEITESIKDLDSLMIDLCVKICCWNHRWYIDFSVILLEAMSVVIRDMGHTKVTNEIAAKYSPSVCQLINDNLLDFFTKFTNNYYDN